MTELRVADDFFLPVPDGFHALTEEEKSGMNTPVGGAWTGMSDPARHILVTGGEKPLNRLEAILLSGRDFARRTEAWIGRAMRGADYRREGFSERTIAGERAFCFRYAYEAGGIPMCAECCSIKRGRRILWLHVYQRQSLRAESDAVWEEILKSARHG
ncbi:MAG: hypothetical protein K6A33_13875 [Clostridiales bacterium]|nr:hypothetical protein [Clostridiales bacterium]